MFGWSKRPKKARKERSYTPGSNPPLTPEERERRREQRRVNPPSPAPTPGYRDDWRRMELDLANTSIHLSGLQGTLNSMTDQLAMHAERDVRVVAVVGRVSRGELDAQAGIDQIIQLYFNGNTR